MPINYVSQISNGFDVANFICNVLLVIINAALVIGVWVAKKSYDETCKSNKKNIAILKAEKAIELSKYYKDNILELSNPLFYVYEQTKISDILYKKIDRVEFNNEELHKYFKDAEILKIKNIYNSVMMSSVLNDANKIYHFNISDDVKIQKAFVLNIVVKLQNNIEYFAMSFSHGIADESVVYQSLHQTYIEIMDLLYYHISDNNIDEKEKMFTNAIALYNTWQERVKNDNNSKNEYFIKILNYEKLIRESMHQHDKEVLKNNVGTVID